MSSVSGSVFYFSTYRLIIAKVQLGGNITPHTIVKISFTGSMIIYLWIAAPGQLPLQNYLQENYPPDFCPEDNYPRIVPPGYLLRMKSPPRTIDPGQLPLNNSPLDNYPQRNCPTTIEKSFELSYFESELYLYLSKTSIATGDPSRGGIVNSLLELSC